MIYFMGVHLVSYTWASGLKVPHEKRERWASWMLVSVLPGIAGLLFAIGPGQSVFNRIFGAVIIAMSGMVAVLANRYLWHSHARYKLTPEVLIGVEIIRKKYPWLPKRKAHGK